MVGRENIDLYAANELVGLLLDQVSAGIALLDRETRFITHNRRWVSDFRLAEENLLGRSLFDFFPELGERWRVLFKRCMAGEKISQDVDRFERQDGNIDWVRWTLSPWHDRAGEVQGALLVSEVLTSQVQDKIRMRVQSEELSLFIDSAENFALCMLDEEGCISIWKYDAERMFGWDEADAVGRPFDIMFDPADLKQGLPGQQLELARRNGTYRDRCWRVRKDGSRFLADVTISVMEREGHLPTGFAQLVRDVTKEDTQSRSLEASTVLLRSILETIPDAMIVIDDQGIVLSFSKAAEDLFGYSHDEVIGRNVSMLMPSPHRERHDRYITRYLATGEPRIIGNKRRVLGRRKDGTFFPHILRVGEAIGGGRRVFTGFLQDLTDTEEAERRYQELRRELTHIARVNEMGTLSTAIAHELNQPLMAIGNIVQTSSALIKEGNEEVLEPVARALDDAGREALRAGAIVKRMRTFMSRGELERTVEDPEVLTQDAWALAAGNAKLREVTCSLKVSEDVADILVDRVQIQQVLLNLVNNAIEAIGRSGKIRINVYPVGGMMRFKVSDTGPGVPPERVSKLFEPFSTTKPSGMGMGLTICRTIVEAHGGELWYEQGPAGGATFAFTLPLLDEETSDVD